MITTVRARVRVADSKDRLFVYGAYEFQTTERSSVAGDLPRPRLQTIIPGNDDAVRAI